MTDIVAISAGALHSVALRSNGTVVAWGYNQVAEDNVPVGLSNVVSIAAGRGYTLALRQDGTLLTWGRTAAVPPTGLSVARIAAGPAHGLGERTGVLTPLILSQPNSVGVKAGGVATFKVSVSSRRQPAYQWQFNGNDITGETNNTLVVNNVQSTDQGVYKVKVSNGAGFVFSSEARLGIVGPPVIVFPTIPQMSWIFPNTNCILTVQANAQGSEVSGLGYIWLKNGEPCYGALGTPSLNLCIPFEPQPGQYSVIVSNIAGCATSAVWTVRKAVSGLAIPWGTNSMVGIPPDSLTSAIALSAGFGHGLGLLENATVLAWGANDYGQTNVPANLTNVVAIAAGAAHSMALKADGTVLAWGRNDYGQTNVPANVNNAVAVSAGGQQSLALLKDGTVVQWGQSFSSVPAGLQNVSSIASGTNFHVALLSNATVVAWGANDFGQTTLPSGLSNVVSIAAGGAHALALKTDGFVIGWGSNGLGESTPPSDLTNAMAIAAGYAHSVALRNDGTVVAWGDNSNGQITPPGDFQNVKLIAAGADFSLTAIYSDTLRYSVDPTKDILLIYNSASGDSSNVWAYYMQHRPMITGANVLPVNCCTNEITTGSNFTNQILRPYLDWLANNPTRHPQYLILFLDVPSRVQDAVGWSVQWRLRKGTPGVPPFVTSINMEGTNACIAYIDKLCTMFANSPEGKLTISANAANYRNTNYYFDNSGTLFGLDGSVSCGWVTDLLISHYGVSPDSITYTHTYPDTGLGCLITNGVNVTGYLSLGKYGMGPSYATNGSVQWSGNSGWWIIETAESFNGRRNTDQGNFIQWFSRNAFGGTNYSNTPVGAATNVEEPWQAGVNDAGIYFPLWAAGRNFAMCVWKSIGSAFLQAVGDPLVAK